MTQKCFLTFIFLHVIVACSKIKSRIILDAFYINWYYILVRLVELFTIRSFRDKHDYCCLTVAFVS